MTKYDSIDVLKFVASFFVVMIHVSIFRDVNPYLNLFVTHGIARLAVPLYFLISAFFFYKKNLTLDKTEYKTALWKYTKRMAVLYLCWFVISFPMTIYNRFIYNGKPFWRIYFYLLNPFSCHQHSAVLGFWYLAYLVFG